MPIHQIILAITPVFSAVDLTSATAARVTPEPDRSRRATTAGAAAGGGLQRWWPVVQRLWCVTCEQRQRNTGSNLCARCDADQALQLERLLDA